MTEQKQQKLWTRWAKVGAVVLFLIIMSSSPPGYSLLMRVTAAAVVAVGYAYAWRWVRVRRSTG